MRGRDRHVCLLGLAWRELQHSCDALLCISLLPVLLRPPLCPPLSLLAVANPLSSLASLPPSLACSLCRSLGQAITRALALFAAFPLDVFLVHYMHVPTTGKTIISAACFARILRERSTQQLGGLRRAEQEGLERKGVARRESLRACEEGRWADLETALERASEREMRGARRRVSGRRIGEVSAERGSGRGLGSDRGCKLASARAQETQRGAVRGKRAPRVGVCTCADS
eukprot:3007367-Rhodomonas_salina.1